MFEAQNANWEETQEKMSQLVSPYRVSCSSFVSNERFFLFHLSTDFFITVQPASSPIPVAPLSTRAAANHRLPLTLPPRISIVLCLPVMSAIDVVKKATG